MGVERAKIQRVPKQFLVLGRGSIYHFSFRSSRLTIFTVVPVLKPSAIQTGHQKIRKQTHSLIYHDSLRTYLSVKDAQARSLISNGRKKSLTELRHHDDDSANFTVESTDIVLMMTRFQMSSQSRMVTAKKSKENKKQNEGND